MEDAKSGKSFEKENTTMNMIKNTKSGFTRDTIKYFALFAMLLNHISYIFMETGYMEAVTGLRTQVISFRIAFWNVYK